MDITAIQQAIQTDLATLGIHAYDHVPDNLVPPAAYSDLPGGYTELTLGRADYQFEFVITVIAATVNTQGGQQQLNNFLNPTGTYSIPAKLYADQSLGSTVESFQITRVGRNKGPRLLAESGVRYWVAEIVLDVFAS